MIEPLVFRFFKFRTSQVEDRSSFPASCGSNEQNNLLILQNVASQFRLFEETNQSLQVHQWQQTFRLLLGFHNHDCFVEKHFITTREVDRVHSSRWDATLQRGGPIAFIFFAAHNHVSFACYAGSLAFHFAGIA